MNSYDTLKEALRLLQQARACLTDPYLGEDDGAREEPLAQEILKVIQDIQETVPPSSAAILVPVDGNGTLTTISAFRQGLIDLIGLTDISWPKEDLLSAWQAACKKAL